MLRSTASPLCFTFSRKPTKPDVPKASPLWIFSAMCDFFFENFLMSSKGPLRVFCYFSTEFMLINPKGVPLLHFSALCDIFRKKINVKISSFFFQKNISRFLSLRYSADFRSSRLVPQKENAPTNFFSHQNGFSKTRRFNRTHPNTKFSGKKI